MRGLRVFFLRLPELWRKENRDRDLRDEMAYLIEMESAAGIAAGMTAEQARRQALMRVEMETTKENYRDRRGLPSLESFLQDLRFGLRMLRRNPGFATVALLTVALGIGANTAMFSAVNAVLLRNLPFRDAERLVMIWEKSSEIHETLLAERIPVRLQSYLYWQSHAQSFDGISAALYDAVNISGSEKPQHVERAAVSGNFFSMLGVPPELGRAFTLEENDSDSARVALISYGLYERQFGKAGDILQRTIKINGVENRIIGVLPRTFHLTSMWGGLDQPKPEVWTPLNTSSSQPMQQQRQNLLMIYGRLKQGVTFERARSEVALLESQLAQQFPKDYDKFSANMFTLSAEDVAVDLRRSLLVLQMAVGFVLLIACVNVANLLLARAAGREREIALRRALGASRGRVVRQMLCESLVFSSLGAAAGLLLAWGGMLALGKLAPGDIHGLHEMKLDVRVLLFTAGVAMVAGLLFGLAPAWHSTRQQLHEAVNRGGRSGHAGMSRGFRNALVVAEIALALAPLAGAGLMIRSLRALNALDLGLDPQHALDGRISLPEIQYKTPAQLLAFCNELLERVSAIPNIESAALTGSPPMESINFTGFKLPGDAADGHRSVDKESVSDGYFAAIGAPILRGRGFTRAEAEQDARVLVISQSLGRKLWPNDDPLGKVMIFNDKPSVVVGIVPDSRVLELGPESRQKVYQPTRSLRDITLVVRGRGDLSQIEAAIGEQLRAINPNLPFYEVNPLTKVAHESLAEQRFTMSLLVAFAVLALLLAAVGLYGVLAYSVAQRTQEIGIRMALGARARDVLGMVLRQGFMAVALGVAIGIAGTLVLTRAMASLLFGVRAHDPITFAAVTLALVCVALLASYLPARRAASIEPMVALRHD